MPRARGAPPPLRRAPGTCTLARDRQSQRRVPERSGRLSERHNVTDKIKGTTLLRRGNGTSLSTSGTRESRDRYRPEIDGLRALAVVPVIFYHAGIHGFGGGFVGVDVFFVISGYLITQILVSDLEQGTFSIARFYERRARRILPALFFVMMVCTPLAWWMMDPALLKGFAETVVAVSVFASNVFFARTTNYFADGADENPLLHTWSLGVEEQFYLVFPLLLLACWRLGRRRVIALMVLIGVASFVLSDHASFEKPVANFFLAPYRAWELLIGVVLELASTSAPVHTRVGRFPRELLAAAGLMLVVAAIASYGSGTRFPGRYAIVPTFGTALVLAFGESNTAVGRFLSSKALVGIGLVSYSAYLIHQPLLAFAKILCVDTPPRALILSLVAASLPLAYLSWRFVESPFRRREVFSARAIFRFAITGSVAFMTFGVGRYWMDRDNHLSYARRTNYGLSGRCEFGDHFEPIPECITAEHPEVLVWGDSYAMHLVGGLLASDSTLGLVQATKSVCGPVLGAAPFSRVDRESTMKWSNGCNSFNRSVLDYIARTPSISVVLLASPFDQYVNGDHYDLVTQDRVARASPSLAVERLRATVEALRQFGKRVVLVAPPPAGRFNMGLCAERLTLGLPIAGPARNCRIDRRDYIERRGPSLELVEAVGKAIDVPILDFSEQLCDRSACETLLGGVPVFRDGGHFSYAGIALLGRRMNLARRVRTAAASPSVVHASIRIGGEGTGALSSRHAP